MPATVGYLPGNAVYLLSYNFFKDHFQGVADRRRGLDKQNNGRQGI